MSSEGDKIIQDLTTRAVNAEYMADRLAERLHWVVDQMGRFGALCIDNGAIKSNIRACSKALDEHREFKTPCPMCVDGWPIYTTGGKASHSLPEPMGMVRCLKDPKGNSHDQ